MYVCMYVPRCTYFHIVQGSVSNSRAKAGQGQSAKRFNPEDVVDLTGVDSDSESPRVTQEPRPDKTSSTPSGITVGAQSCTFSKLFNCVYVLRCPMYTCTLRLGHSLSFMRRTCGLPGSRCNQFAEDGSASPTSRCSGCRPRHNNCWSIQRHWSGAWTSNK